MSQKCVSVIIPCFNRGEVVARAIMSVLQQTHADFEVIIVDDASTDGGDLARIIREIGDPRVKLVKHERNAGGGAARNTGVANAVGDYVAFLDSDDEWFPNKLEKQMAMARNQADANWLIYTQSEVITMQTSGRQRSIMPLQGINAGQAVGDYLFAGRGWLQTSSMLLSVDLAKKCFFNPALRRHQDYDFLLHLEAQGCRFQMVDEPLVVVHWEDMHQTSRGLNPQRSLDFLRDYHGFLSSRARSGFVYHQIVSRLLREKRRREALEILVSHVRLWHLRPASLVTLFSEFLFGDARLAVSVAKAIGKRRG